MTYDLVIRGGTIIDGTGTPAVRGDVAISNGRIAAVGDVTGSARTTIEADGRVVAPGFVDIHTHYDAQIFWDRLLTISPWHGVTTVVMGNCGFGVAPTRPGDRGLILRTLEKVEGMSLEALEAGLGSDWPFETFPQYLDAIERRGVGINVGALIGHTPVRMYVMGEASTERAATDEEIARMREIVRDGIRAGAVGFATSRSPTHIGYAGRPVPSRAAEMTEIEALIGALSDAGAGIVQATAGPGFFISEFADIVRRSGRTFTWTALLAGMMGEGSHRWMLDMNADVQSQGLPVIPQVSCRPLMFEFQMKEPFIFESMPVFQPVSAADLEGKKRIYRDPDFRRRFKETFGSAVLSGRWERTWIAASRTATNLEERTVSDVATSRGVDPVDLVLDLSLAENLETRFRMAVVNTDENAVGELLQHPATMLGLSDAGAHASQLCDACFATDLLARWVREKKTLSLEQAVRMLTSRPAEVFGLHDRGRLARGVPADVVIFDPERVGASPLRRVQDLPAGADRLVSEATGIDAVIVNGTVLRREGRDALDPAGPLPGRVLRSGRFGSASQS